MNYPLISEYIEAIKSAEDNFATLTNLRPVIGGDGNPVMTSGNFAVVFKMEDEQTGKFYAVKCFLKDQPNRAESYKMIAEELEFVSSTFLVQFRYLDNELFVDTNNSDKNEFPVLVMDWVEGVTLDKYIRQNIDDQYALQMLAYQFSKLAMWIIPQPFAHGDIKPDNIMVRNDGSLVLIDYDGMYVPAMKGQKARELGSPDFRHPSRTEDDFDEHIDDFPLISILLSLSAIANDSSLLEKYGANDRLLFSEKDYRNISSCQLLKELFPSTISELNILLSIFVVCLEKRELKGISYSLFNINEPNPLDVNYNPYIQNKEFFNSWTDDYGVIYSYNGTRLLKAPTNLKSYTVRKGTVVICSYAFSNCKRLSSIRFPKSLKIIGDSVFEDCENLKDISLPNIYEISNGCFANCSNLKSILIPDSVNYIGQCAFFQCSNLKSIEIPDSVTEIGSAAFSGCLSLKNIKLSGGLKEIADEVFEKCTSLESILIPEGIKAIGNEAFSDCIHLTDVYLPNSLNSIANIAFYNCGFSSIKIPDGVTWIGSDAFSGCTNLSAIQIPNTVKSTSDAIFNHCDNLRFVVLPNELSKIEDEMFAYCKSIEFITIPSSVKEIGTSSFSNCTSLRTINIPNSVSKIGDKAFSLCKNLNTISISNSTTFISEDAFDSCDSLQSIIIPKGSWGYYEQTLPNYRNILIEQENPEDISTKVSSQEIATAWSDKYGALYSQNKKKILRLPLKWDVNEYSIINGTKVICDEAFSNNFILFNVFIPDSITQIGKRAFRGCSNLCEVKLPPHIHYIDTEAFAYCAQLHKIIIPVGTKEKFDKILPSFKDKLVEPQFRNPTK